MVASLTSAGKMAVVMPHGVLFRGGEEKACRQRFIHDGLLEAVIGLPPGLFYGTGIPACALVLNKQRASTRQSVLFINADCEYKEGKNQNVLRPEDIDKITHVYHQHLEVPHYARNVPISELAQESFNLNIRRYVDNSPPPEPHDVRAHLHGGVPVCEINALQGYFDNYPGVGNLLFQPRAAATPSPSQDALSPSATGGTIPRRSPQSMSPLPSGEGEGEGAYMDFASTIASKDHIKPLIDSASGVKAKHEEFHKALDDRWMHNVPLIEALPISQNVFKLRREFLTSIAEALVPQGMLDLHQIRGAFAAYMNRLAADFKSVAASGWSAELIPETEILQSQFPEVLEQIERDQARMAELEALFAAAEGEDADADDVENAILPKEVVRSLRADKKAIGGELTCLKKDLKAYHQDIKRLNPSASLFGETELTDLPQKAAMAEQRIAAHTSRVAAIDEQLVQHAALEQELKTLRAHLWGVEKKKDGLVAAAHAMISEDEAKQLIVERFKRLLTEQFDEYLRQNQRGLIAAIENLWQKYAVTMKQILAERDREAAQLDRFLVELGYECLECDQNLWTAG
jgi:type I restriction enzyme M protein